MSNLSRTNSGGLNKKMMMNKNKKKKKKFRSSKGGGSSSSLSDSFDFIDMEAIRHVRSPTFAAHQLGSFSGGSGSGSDVDGSPKPRFMRTGSMASFSSVGAPGEPSSVNPSALDDLDTMVGSFYVNIFMHICGKSK